MLMGVGSNPINCIVGEVFMGNLALYVILLLIMVYVDVTSFKKYKKNDSVRNFISLCLSGVITIAIIIIMLSIFW